MENEKNVYDKEVILRLYESEKVRANIARQYCQEKGIPYSDNVRKAVSKLLVKVENQWEDVGDPDLGNDTSTDSNNYKNDKEKKQTGFTAIGEDGKLMSIEKYCEFYGLDRSTVRSYKLITHQGIPFLNVVFFTPEEKVVLNLEDHLEHLISKHIQPVAITPIIEKFRSDDWFDRLVYTDTHINMDVQGDGDPLYDGKWDKTEILRRLEVMVAHTLEYSKSSELYIDDLGDFMDGLGGYTTRGGHKLPQLTNDKEAFELGLEFKLKLVDSLIPHYDKIYCNEIVNDNHSGVYSFFVCTAAKQILEQRYPGKVFVSIKKRFMEHYSVGKHTFVIFHGKDVAEMKMSGFKPKLDPAQIEKIDQFCKEMKLYNGNFIEVGKGNDHQSIFDDTTSNDFQYYSYLAFSPPSNYVKTNFKNSKSGFKLYNIHRDKNIKLGIPYFF